MRLFTSSGLIIVAAFAALLSACGSGTPAKHAPMSAAADSSCPVAVPGTTVTVDDTATGAALVFATTGDVVELRRRVTAMATMHNDHQAKMAAHATMGDDGHAMGSMDRPAGGMAGMDHGGMAGMDHGGMGGMDHGGMAGMDHGGMAGMKGMMMVPSSASAEELGRGARIVLVAAPTDVAALRDQLRMHAKQMAGGTCMMMGSH